LLPSHWRNPEQPADELPKAAFTIKEARELMKIPGVAFHPAEASLIPPDLKHLPRAARRLMEVVVKGSQSDPETAKRSWSLDFCLSPKAFLPSDQHPGHVGTSVLEQTELSSRFDPAAQPRLTGREIRVPSSTVFRSIGYKSSPLPGFEEAGVLFDQRSGVIMNDGMGRVLQNEASDGGSTLRSATYPGLYCAGWVKRGPTGVIANTMQDAFESGDSIVQDWLSGVDFLNHGDGETRAGWQGICQTSDVAMNVVHWSGWQKIDSAERARGVVRGKEREKFTSTAEMLEAAS
jgi:adrenodoxin-NADP+ reductase